MSRYDRQIAQAVRLIKKFGQEVTWRQPAVTVNADQPWKAATAEPVEYRVSVLFLRPSGGLARALYHLIKSTDAPSGAPRGLMAAVPFTPQLTDQVIRDGSVLVISTIDITEPNGEPILYDIEFA